MSVKSKVRSGNANANANTRIMKPGSHTGKEMNQLAERLVEYYVSP